MNWNWSYSPETPNLGQIRRFLEPCDLEIWRMTLKNKRAPLLSIIKLYASFHHHMWIKTGVTVRKRLSWVVTSVTLTLTFCMDVTSVRLSVCPSVTPFHNVPIIVSSWNFQELLPWSKVMSMQKVKVRGQRSRSQRSTPNLAVSRL